MFFRVCAVEIQWRRFNASKTSLQNHLRSRLQVRRTALTRRTTAMVFSVVLAACGFASYATAQQFEAGVPNSAVVPKAPAGASVAVAAPPADPKSNGALYGTAVDSNGGVISGATVTLSGPVSRTITSDSGGNFSFTHLPSGTFSLKVTGSGMSPAQVPDIVLRPGGVRFLPPVVLQVAAASTSVQVFANPEELAEQQLQLQLHQRVLGFLPNYFSSYDWNAVHLWPKQKFELGYRSEIDPVTVAIIAGEAGLDQISNRYPGYGEGVEGYAKRYGADYATDFVGTMIGDVALPTLFHQDPRYFYKGTGSFGSRALYAVSRTFICRGDSGHPQFDYSRILGDIAAGGISNTYYPAGSRGVGLVFINAGVDLAANASTNLIREFILPGLTSHVPKGIKEKSPIHF
jgi:Carboxypeptidase regulatory-like domain